MTHAVYGIWAGVKLKEADESYHPFFDEVQEHSSMLDPVTKKGNLDFTMIIMHGEVVGIGVYVGERLDWNSEIDETNHYDCSIRNEAISVLSKVEKVFRDMGITCEPRLYHHIDLGG